MLATTVFPTDPDKIMQFGCWDEAKLERLAYVSLAPSQIGPHGLRIGMTVAEVESLNGEPFLLSDFWWDYGGYARIKSGKLASVWTAAN